MDGDVGIGWLNSLAGIEVGVPVSPYEKLQLGLFSKIINGDIETRRSVGIYLRMGAVYVIAVAIMAACYAAITGDLQTGVNIIQQYWNSVSSLGCI